MSRTWTMINFFWLIYITRPHFRCFQIGLVEKEWLDTLSTINPEEVTYTDFVDAGTMLARELKETKNCEIVIALTHMRTPNDIRLAENVSEIDLILGGHDHIYEKKKVIIALRKSPKCFVDIKVSNPYKLLMQLRHKRNHIKVVKTFSAALIRVVWAFFVCDWWCVKRRFVFCFVRKEMKDEKKTLGQS